jgi:hypothetical protein
VRLDAPQDALDVRRYGAVAAQEPVPPQQPQVAGTRYRMFRYGWRIIGVRQAFGALRQDVL